MGPRGGVIENLQSLESISFYIWFSYHFDAPECRFWVWLLVWQLSRGCLAISVKHLKCNEHMLNMKIQKHFQRRKIILIS